MTRFMTLLFAALLIAGLTACGGDDHDDHDDHDEHGEEKAEHHNEVELTPEAIKAARIEVAPAQTGTFTTKLSVPGRITLDPRSSAVVSAWIGGQIDTIHVRPGDAVKKGDLLARVRSTEIGTAIAAYRTEKANDAAADARLARARKLQKEGVTSRAQVLEAEAIHTQAEGALEAAEERLRVMGVAPSNADPHAGQHFPSRVPVRSPIAGKVLTTDASAGERVAPGRTLFHVGDLDEVWVMLDIYERDLSAVAKGQVVHFTVEAWPGVMFSGTVDQVGDWIDPDSRTVEVRVIVANPEHRLKPNMFAKAELSVSSGAQPGIVLPASAVQEVEKTTSVFVEGDEPGHFQARTVQVGRTDSVQVLVTAGLEEGERVVVSGAFALKSELEKSELGDGHAH